MSLRFSVCVERGYEFERGGGITEEVFEMVGAGFPRETDSVIDHLRQRFRIQRK